MEFKFIYFEPEPIKKIVKFSNIGFRGNEEGAMKE